MRPVVYCINGVIYWIIPMSRARWSWSVLVRPMARRTPHVHFTGARFYRIKNRVMHVPSIWCTFRLRSCAVRLAPAVKYIALRLGHRLIHSTRHFHSPMTDHRWLWNLKPRLSHSHIGNGCMTKNKAFVSLNSESCYDSCDSH